MSPHVATDHARRVADGSLIGAIAAPDRSVPDWTAIVAVVLGVTAFAVAQGLTYPLISLTLESRRVPALLIGLNAASFSAGLAGATLSLHRLTRVIAGDRLIVVALLGCAVALTVFSLNDSLAVWFIARLMLGFGAGLVFIMSEAWLHAAAPDRLRGRVSGIYGAGMCIGFAAGPLAIPLFGSAHGFAFAAAAAYLASVAVLSAILGHRARTKPHAVQAGALLTIVRRAPILVVMVVAFGFADIVAISGMPIYIVRMGHSDAFAALSVSAMAVPTAIAQPVVGALLDRLPRLSVAIGAGLVAAASFFVLPLLQSDVALLIDFAVLGSASFAIYTCALTLLGDRFTGGLLVAGTAVFSLAYATGSASGSSVIGAVMELLPPAMSPIVIGLIVLGLTATFPLDRRSRAQK